MAAIGVNTLDHRLETSGEATVTRADPVPNLISIPMVIVRPLGKGVYPRECTVTITERQCQTARCFKFFTVLTRLNYFMILFCMYNDGTNHDYKDHDFKGHESLRIERAH